jgi:hypothetical protein
MSEGRQKPLTRDRDLLKRAVLAETNIAARASVVNRTHRVVRERARTIAARQSKVRSLWIPLAVCSSLLVIICTAVWSALDAYEATPNGVPDASNQFLVLCLWFLPVSMALLAVVLFQRARKREAAQ